MASVDDYHISANIAPSTGRSNQHQRSKSSVLKSFIHRRHNSDGSELPPTNLLSPSNLTLDTPPTPKHDSYGFPNFSRPAALGEIQQNQVSSSPRSPTKHQDQSNISQLSPTKIGFNTISTKPSAVKEAERLARLAKQNEGKPKKTKSATNLVGFLSRPKSSKNLNGQASEDEMRFKKNKENQPPQEAARAPIYAQFSSGALEKQNDPDYAKDSNALNLPTNGKYSSNAPSSGRANKERPKSYHAPFSQSADMKPGQGSTKASPSKIQRGLRLFGGGGSASSQDRPRSPEPSERVLDPKDIDKHLEAMLDRRNIPEHQRYKMRSLADTIKMEFIRQDWAESRGLQMARPGSHDSDSSSLNATQANEQAKPKKSRGRSFTMSRGKKSAPGSPTKKSKGEGSIGRHFRSRSTDSVATSDRPLSSTSSTGSSIFSKVKLQQGPVDFVAYLRKVQKPQLVEVGKLHKLRLLLRNETVAWTEEFIRQGGMQEIVALLHRIIEVEWRYVLARSRFIA